MSKEILMVVDAVSNEKGVEKEIIFEALEFALVSVTKRRDTFDSDYRISVDRSTGEYTTFRCWDVYEEEPEEGFENPDSQLTLEDAQKVDPDAEVGSKVEEQVESVEFGRIAAQTAKQVIIQKVREAERKRVIDRYSPHQGELIGGVVKQMLRGGAIIDLGDNVEAYIPKDKMIPREPIRPGDRVRGLLVDVCEQRKGPQLFVSRVAPEFLIELFTLEVPEIGEGLIEVKSAARDPGLRAKIAVQTKDKRLDPVGACVGMRGSRVQAVSNELAGERVDIVLWDENHAQFVINAMAPAEVSTVIVDEDKHRVDMAVSEDNLSQAIGRGGQNVKLASQLTEWTLNVVSDEEFEEKIESENINLQQLFMDELDVDEELASVLVQEGFSSLEEVAYVAEDEMLAVEEFDEDIVAELRSRAQDVLLTKAIAKQEQATGVAGTEELLTVEGVNGEIANALVAEKVTSCEDLAELSSDELLMIDGLDSLDGESADKLIIAAREQAGWFE